MLKLKNYQEKSLDSLRSYFRYLNVFGKAEAYQKVLNSQGRGKEKFYDLFETAPSVCLRVPTGGGKTLMAAHSIGVVGSELQGKEFPTVLWLTPSDAIRSQTFLALSNPSHPYRQALTAQYGDRLRICELDDLNTINAQDIEDSCVVVISTIQALNVSNTTDRNFYSFREDLSPHFQTIPHGFKESLDKVSESDIEAQPYLKTSDLGRIKHSVANWLFMRNPIVIVDEAHNNKTDRFFKTLTRLNPACIIELTATPIEGNNILYSVSAQELRAEEMIKLPIVLSEHETGWEDCLRDAILTRNKLELVAQKETDYVRPIALIQAQPRDEDATVEKVKAYLINEEKIDEDQIAIATGDQRDLDGINLFDPACPIRYVITVQALKEGWDCSFAYVLASLQNVRSATSVEQLLGRVLRMPYAKNREQQALNKAYAHIVADSFAEAAKNLRDRMVQNMGFERLEMASAVIEQVGLPGFNNDPQKPVKLPESFVTLSVEPSIETLPPEIKALVEVKPTSQGATVLIKGEISDEALNQVEAHLSTFVKDKELAELAAQFQEQRLARDAISAPSERGETFAPIPQLCLNLDGDLELVEQETLSMLGSFNLLDHKVQLDNFSLNQETNVFEIDVSDQHITYKLDFSKQLDLNEVESNISEQDLVRWLSSQVRDKSFTQTSLLAYLVKLISYLENDRKFTKTALVRGRVPLSKAIDYEIKRLKAISYKTGFQAALFDMVTPNEKEFPYFSFQFEPGVYPARNIYSGAYRFKKHFYAQIHDLREKTEGGKESEEFQCAQAIDRHPLVRHWIRNVERAPKQSFWLPTATDYFYPDFILELTDGRIMAVEFKGEPYVTNDDSMEKKQVGHQWEKASQGKCLFIMAVKKDEDGRDVYQQIDEKITKALV